MTYIGIILVFTLINNVVFSQLLGTCEFVCEPGNALRKLRLGISISAVASITAAVIWVVFHGLLRPLSAEILLLPSVILVAVAVTAVFTRFTHLLSPGLDVALGDSFALMFANCVVVAVALSGIRSDYTILQSLVAGGAAGLGFMLASFLLSSVKERLDVGDVPETFQGAPIMFISAGLMALAFMAFDRALLVNLVG
jgi:Na+-translocating ferredoxin:NAD+ oxidoreductase subunit A